MGALPSFQRASSFSTLRSNHVDDNGGEHDALGNDDEREPDVREPDVKDVSATLSTPLHRIDSVGDALRDGAFGSPSPDGTRLLPAGAAASQGTNSSEPVPHTGTSDSDLVKGGSAGVDGAGAVARISAGGAGDGGERAAAAAAVAGGEGKGEGAGESRNGWMQPAASATSDLGPLSIPR